MSRRSYPVQMTVNGRTIHTVVIDPHYELKHSKSINDELILELVSLLDGQRFYPESEHAGFQYFRYEGLELKDRLYRLVWILERDLLYIGVANAHRRN